MSKTVSYSLHSTVYPASIDAPGDATPSSSACSTSLSGDHMLSQSQPRKTARVHAHSNILVSGPLPSVNRFRSVLREHGFLEIGPDRHDVDKTKFARQGSVIHVPNDGSPNFDGSLRMALLQMALALDLPIVLPEMPKGLLA